MQAQERWDDFTNVKFNMLKNTHTHTSPWTIIRSDNKQKARKEAIKVILDSVDYENRSTELDFVLDNDIVISGARELETMKAQRTKSGKFTG